MKTKTYLITAILFSMIVFLSSFAYSQPDVKIVDKKDKEFLKLHPSTYQQDFFTFQQVAFDANNLATFINNRGVFNRNRTNNNTPGLEWPKGSGKYVCFSAGLCIAAR